MINNLLTQVQQLTGQALQNNTPNDPIAANGPRPQTASVPFWDLPNYQLDASNNAFSPWDVCILGGLWLPGIAKVQVKAKKRFDVKKKKGRDGAKLTFTGYDPSELSITLRLWVPVQLDTLQSLMPMLKAKSTSAAGAQATAAQLALDIGHPSTALLGIHSVLIESVGGLEPGDKPGVMQMQIHCLEYIPDSHGDNTSTVKQSQNFTNPTAINVSKAGPPMPSADASFTGPDGLAH